MKACVITIEYPPVESGVAVACSRMVKWLKSDVHVLTFGPGRDSHLANRPRQLASDGNVHRISPYSGSLTNVPPQEVQNLCFYLGQLHSKHRFDLLHGFNLTGSGFVAAYMGKKLGIPSIVSVRGNDIGRDVFDQTRLAAIRWTLENAGLVTFVANDLLEQADIVSGCRKKSRVILNSLDPFDFFYRDIKLRLDGFVVCYSGVVRRKKGFGYLLGAFSEFVKKHRATLLIIGEFQPEEKLSYLRMIDELQLQGNIMVTGRVAHSLVLNYLSLADAFVLPSLSEGCSNALLEAMFAKRACIATRVGAAEDIITDGRDGLLIEPHCSEGIYKALVRLRSAALRRRLGRAAKEKIIAKFRPEDEVRQWLQAYKKCTG